MVRPSADAPKHLRGLRALVSDAPKDFKGEALVEAPPQVRRCAKALKGPPSPLIARADATFSCPGHLAAQDLGLLVQGSEFGIEM